MLPAVAWGYGGRGMLDSRTANCQLKDCHAAAWWLLPAAGNAGLRFNL